MTSSHEGCQMSDMGPELPLRGATRKLPLICWPLLTVENVLSEVPNSAYWQDTVCRVDACRVSRNFYVWIFQAIA